MLPTSNVQQNRRVQSGQENGHGIVRGLLLSVWDYFFNPPEFPRTLEDRNVANMQGFVSGFDRNLDLGGVLGVDIRFEEEIRSILKRWVLEGPEEEKSVREGAQQKIEIFLEDLSLDQLNFSGAGLSSLPDIWNYPSFATRLKKLDLIFNQIKEVPESIGYLRSLEYLDISHNQMLHIPESIGRLENLSELYLCYNKIGDVSEFLGDLSSLTILNLAHNKIQRVPESIGKLQRLETCKIYANKLQSIPESIGNLVHLTDLDCSQNQILAVPSSIGSLRALVDLNLSNNKISAIPVSLGNVQSLKKLYLFDNEIQEIPSSLGSLTDLRELYLFNNPIQAFQLELLQLSPDCVISITGSNWSNQELTQMQNLIGNRRIYIDS